MSKPPIAITCGDPAGVGPEVIQAWLQTAGETSGDIEVIGPAAWLRDLPDEIATRSVGPEGFAAEPGKPTAEGAKLAWDAMKVAAAGCREGRYRAVATGPVNKAQLVAVGYPHPGQTEFFAAEWGGEPVMAFLGNHLRVVLATWHVPLAAVPSALTPEVLTRAIQAALRLVEAEGIAAPRIGVCGLNPHAGEEGLLGSEERETIDPVLDGLRGQIPGLSRTLPGDTVFGRALQGQFDAVVALYHDQGLGPLKTVDFDNAVNITLGLPFVRTSPDHGTGYDIAGKGIASSTSMGRAIEIARRLSESSQN